MWTRLLSVSRILLWPLFGICAGLVGWQVGGLLGSFFPRIVCTAAFVGGVYGLLCRNGLLASGAFLAGGVGSCLGYGIGAPLSPPLLAWPFGGLAIGLMSGMLCKGTWGIRVLHALAGLILGGFGFGISAFLGAAIGYFSSTGWVFGEFMRIGAAGYGACVVTGLVSLRWFLKRRRSRT